jgi:hypothetical protein
MSELAFLSPDQSDGVALSSPLARLLGDGDASVKDVSALAKLEVRGELSAVALETNEELIRISSQRGLLIADTSTAARRARLRAAGLRVYDMTGALAGFAVSGEQLMRRLTELDLEALPAAGAIARGVPALLERREGGTFRFFVPQELGYYVAEVVLHIQESLGES